MLEKGNKTEEEMHINVGRVNRSIALTQRLHCSAIPKVPNWRSTYENCTKMMPNEQITTDTLTIISVAKRQKTLNYKPIWLDFHFYDIFHDISFTTVTQYFPNLFI